MKVSQRRERARAKRSRRATRQRGGGATGMPMHYYTDAVDTQMTSHPEGTSMLPAPGIIRPALPMHIISGGRRQRRAQSAGFYPSVMGSFADNASRLAVPLAGILASQYLHAPAYFRPPAASRRPITAHSHPRKKKDHRRSRHA